MALASATGMLLLPAMIGRIGIQELLIILIIALLIFGPKKLPQLGKSMGATIHNFRKGVKKGQKEAAAREDEEDDDEEEV